MRLLTRILFGLGGFLLAAATVYWLMSYQGAGRDPAGPALMGVAAIGLGYTGLVLWAAARRADREAAAEQTAPGPKGATMAHVPPTIWPCAYAIAADTRACTNIDAAVAGASPSSMVTRPPSPETAPWTAAWVT